MCQKSIINNPKTVVKEMLDGISFAHPGVEVNSDEGYIILNKERKKKVALVCGCGAGYEPYATGFVGEGMLTAYISGIVARPPKSKVIFSVITSLAELNSGGVLILMLNYPREVLNFGLAIERARLLGLRVESVVLVDDCSRWKAMRNEHYTNLAYKKGMCGCIFSFKILGAMSTMGAPLSHMVSEARALNFRTTTLGFGLEPFCVPGGCKPGYTIPHGTAVIGMGINGESGIRIVELDSAKNIIRKVLPKVVEESNLTRKSTIFLQINCQSSMTGIESYIIAKEVHNFLRRKRIFIIREIVGRFFPSFDAKGAHISIVNICGRGDDWLTYFDMGTEAYAWPNLALSVIHPEQTLAQFTNEEAPPPKESPGMTLNENEKDIFLYCIQDVCYALIESQTVLNLLNVYDGNGDTGSKLRKFAEAVLQVSHSLPTEDVSLTLQALERIAEQAMSGKIGAVYTALLFGASRSPTSWSDVFKAAVRFLGAHFPIVTGCRTLFDVIRPACEDFTEYWDYLGPDLWRTALLFALDTAERACYETAKTTPKVGVYYSDRKMNMDAGAFSVVVWLRTLNASLGELLPPPTSEPTSDDWRYNLESLLLSNRATPREREPSEPQLSQGGSL